MGYEFLGGLYEALADYRAWGILLMIFLDWAFGVAAALKAGKFDISKLANFYKTNVIPYLIGYTAVFMTMYVIEAELAATEWYGKFDWLFEPGLVTGFWLTLVGTLGNSILRNLNKLGLGLGEK